MVYLIVAMLLAVLAGPAAGHGLLQGSSPAPNAVLPASPPEAVLAFNEPIDATFSRIAVTDAAGRNIAGPAHVSEGGRRMRASLPTLPAGVYTVRWRVLSTVDGHVTAGSFVFAVGTREQPQTRPETGIAPPPSLVAFRWAALLTGLLLAGIIVFHAAVLTPALSRLAPDIALQIRAVAAPRLETWRMVSAVLVLLSLAVEFTGQAALLLGGDLSIVARRAVLGPLLIETRGGWSLLVRAAMAALLLMPGTPPWRILRGAGLVWFVIVTAVIVFLGGPAAVLGSHVTVIVLVAAVYGLASVLAAVILPAIPDLRIPEGRWVRPAAAALLLWGYTLSSHAAAGGAAAMAVDWLHLAGVALWVGGLPALLRVLSALPDADRRAAGRILVPRVSQAAGLALVVVVLTGLLAAIRNVGVWTALLPSLYGRLLLIKVALVLPLMTLGALNRFVYRPGIARGQDGPALARFRRSVTVEVAIGTMILLVVAVLSITPPAAVTQPASEAVGVVLAGIADDLRVRLSVTPAGAGWNDVQAAVARIDSGAPVADATVRLRLHAMDRVEDRSIDLLPSGGTYTASGDVLATGWWEIAVEVRHGGRTRETRVPLVVGDVERQPDAGAEQLLARARRQMRTIRSWVEAEQLTDGAGNVVATRFEVARPDRLRYRTTSGSEATIIGAERYSRERDGDWVRDELPQPLALEGLYLSYLTGADKIRFGREEFCPDEPCRVVLWEIESARASFAARVGLRTGRIHTLAMVAPSHYMTSVPSGLNMPVRIIAP